MIAPHRRSGHDEACSAHPWQAIPLSVYEAHMSDAEVGQLQRLRAITAEQLADHRPRSATVLGVAGGNGLDAVNPARFDEIVGIDLNAEYLEACEARYRGALGDRLHLIEARIDRSLRLSETDLVIANLIVEYVGVDEFAAFAGVNADRIGVLSVVVQRNDDEGFVSRTEYTSAFSGLASVSSDVDAGRLVEALDAVGFTEIGAVDHPLPNRKTLVRRDFRRRWTSGSSEA